MISAGTIIIVTGSGNSSFHPEWGVPEMLADERGRVLFARNYQGLTTGLRSIGLMDDRGRVLGTEGGLTLSGAYLVG